MKKIMILTYFISILFFSDYAAAITYSCPTQLQPVGGPCDGQAVNNNSRYKQFTGTDSGITWTSDVLQSDTTGQCGLTIAEANNPTNVALVYVYPFAACTADGKTSGTVNMNLTCQYTVGVFELTMNPPGDAITASNCSPCNGPPEGNLICPDCKVTCD